VPYAASPALHSSRLTAPVRGRLNREGLAIGPLDATASYCAVRHEVGDLEAHRRGLPTPHGQQVSVGRGRPGGVEARQWSTTRRTRQSYGAFFVVRLPPQS
jgi:hypothetical protein